MSRQNYRIMTAAASLALLAGTTAAQTGPKTIRGEHMQVDYAGHVTQDFIVPGYYGSQWTFTIEGADGGDAERRRNGNQVELYYGGQGATLYLVCDIGNDAGQLRPGGKIRFIIGEAGQMHGCLTYSPSFGRSGAGGGGGAGSGILYLPPGETDWNNAEILAVAGGGGGAYVISGPTSQEGDGGNATLNECGANPVYGCTDDFIFYGCGGAAGHDPGQWSEPHMGLGVNDTFPNGGRVYDDIYVDDYGSWGLGGGGVGYGGWKNPGAVGGGGGYSGGAGYNTANLIDPQNFDCRGGAGGGGSYINPLYAWSESRHASNTGYHGLGSAQPYWAQLANDEWYGAVDLTDGDIAAAVFDIATARATLDFCGQPVTDPDVWFKYTNDDGCPRQVTLTAETNTFDGLWVAPGTVKIYGYTGYNPAGSDCRASSASGVYQDVVQPGEIVTFRLSSSNPEAASRLRFETEVVAGTNQNLFSPASVVEGTEQTEYFCGSAGTLDYTDCDPTLTSGHVAYYEYINAYPCTMDATFKVTSGILHEFRVFDVVNGCVEDHLGAITSTLAPGDKMLLQIISQTGNPMAFRIDSDYASGQADCDNDGIPDSCDTDSSGCPVANDDMAGAIPLPLGTSPYSSAPATLDGSASCEPSSPGSDNADVWFTHTATQDGQLVVSSLTDAGAGNAGRVGLAIFTEDGQTELACDAGAQFNRISGQNRDAVALTSVRAGQKVLIRLTAPDVPYGNPLGNGHIYIDLDTSLPNDICEHATVVTTPNGEPTSVAYDLTYSQLDPSPDCMPSAFDGRQFYDAWFEYTATENGLVNFSAQRSPVNNLRGAVTAFDDCGGTQLGCVAWMDTPVPLTLGLPMTAGQTVKIRVSAIDADFGPSTFTVSIPDGCTADWNADTLLNTSDFLDYLNDYNAMRNGNPPTYGDPDLAAPFGSINTSDLLAFLNAYNTGCP